MRRMQAFVAVGCTAFLGFALSQRRLRKKCSGFVGGAFCSRRFWLQRVLVSAICGRNDCVSDTGGMDELEIAVANTTLVHGAGCPTSALIGVRGLISLGTAAPTAVFGFAIDVRGLACSLNRTRPRMLETKPQQPTMRTSRGFETTWTSTKRWIASRKMDMHSATSKMPLNNAPRVCAQRGTPRQTEGVCQG
jgi:hypothetical protein